MWRKNDKIFSNNGFVQSCPACFVSMPTNNISSTYHKEGYFLGIGIADDFMNMISKALAKKSK
jgi:hypothetical protein